MSLSFDHSSTRRAPHSSTRSTLRARRAAAALAALISWALAAGCGGGGEGNPGGSVGGGGSSGDGAGGTLFGGSGGGGPGISIPPDSAFVPADIGSYALGEALGSQGVGETGVVSMDGCDTLVGAVRDFRGADEAGGHPDFQAYSGDDATTGLVEYALGADYKPVYASQCEAANPSGDCPYGPQTTSKVAFNEWYRFEAATNQPYLIYFKFETKDGISTFESKRFFPLDGAGWGNSGTDEDGVSRNFHFTTELHTKFKYQGGETFRFSGDDDLWVFINGKLGIDLGGLHPAVTAQIDLDQSANELGIEKGGVYPLELFHAERHTSASNFRVDTNLAFVDCGTVLPDPK